MLRYTSQEIAEIVSGQLSGSPDIPVSSVVTDSRSSASNTQSAFFALKGPNHNGHLYIREMVEKGIRTCIVDEATESFPPEVAIITVPDTLKALQQLAAHYRGCFTGKVLAITGSNGKTIVKEWISTVLSTKYRISKSPKSYNSQVGVALSILQSAPDSDIYIFEAGISRPGEMDQLQQMIRPDYGIITNIGDAHQENFSSKKNKLAEKLKLFQQCDKLYYCADHQTIASYLHEQFRPLQTALSAWGSKKNEPCQIRFIRKENQGSILHLTANTLDLQVPFPFSDFASLENGAHVLHLCLDQGLTPSVIQQTFATLEPVAMRMQQINGVNGCTLINDYYNSDYQSVQNAIDLLWQQTHQKDKTLILSDLLQTGDSPETMISKIQQITAGKGFNRIIGIGEVLHTIGKQSGFLTQTYRDTDRFLQEMKLSDFQNEAILLKGARPFHFEHIKERLEEKIHRTILKISMPVLLNNLNLYRQYLKKDTRIMGMVKAFSYGSGSHEVSRFLAHQKIDYLAVAFVDEGIQLRKAGVQTPIMVMNPDFTNVDALVKYQLEPEVFNSDGLSRLKNRLHQIGVSQFPIHLKLDTGMHRLGFTEQHLRQSLPDLLSEPFKIASIFSHLAAAGDPAQDEFTHLQIRRLETCYHLLAPHLTDPPLKHVLNTAGIERFPEAQFDMVRLGIGLYGLGGDILPGLNSPITFQSYISQIHTITSGDTIGYDRTGQLPDGGKIGIIPVGYADGFDRRLGNGNWNMTLNNQQIPTIGQICMDMCMVDLTHVAAREGNLVTIVEGKAGIEKMAEKLQTIPYEIITGFSSRITRMYEFD